MAKAKKAAVQNDVVALLNQQVANWTVMYTKIHNYHWYVKGPTFFALHVKFEELYNEASVYIDDVAERILAIGGHPIATLKESLEMSIVKEAKKDLTADDMVADLHKDFEKVIKQLREGQQVAEQAGDAMTADMILAMITSLEKHNWMFASYLGK